MMLHTAGTNTSLLFLLLLPWICAADPVFDHGSAASGVARATSWKPAILPGATWNIGSAGTTVSRTYQPAGETKPFAWLCVGCNAAQVVVKLLTPRWPLNQGSRGGGGSAVGLLRSVVDAS